MMKHYLRTVANLLVIAIFQTPSAFASMTPPDLRQACLASGDADYAQSQLSGMDPEVQSSPAAANILLDSGQLKNKIKAFDVLMKDTELLKSRYYPSSEIETRLAEFFKRNTGDPANQIEAAKQYIANLPLDLRKIILDASRTRPHFTSDIESSTKALLEEQKPMKTEIFASAQAMLAPHACDLVVNAKWPDYRQRLAGCMKVAEFLITETSPTEVGGEQVSFLPLVMKALIDPVYIQGLAVFAETILKKVDFVKAHADAYEKNPQSLGDFFEDAVNAFESVDQQAGHNVAVRRAFETMALYGSRGTGFVFLTYLVHKENLSIEPSLQIISAGSNVLNRASLFSNKVYAFPEFVKINCQVDRPYHFWLGAYMARIAMQTKKFTPKDIFSAIHALRVAYKLLGPTSVWQEYFMEQFKKAYVLETQKDIVTGAVGVLGVLQSTSADFQLPNRNMIPPIDVDQLILDQANASRFTGLANPTSILDNLPIYIRPFLSTFEGFDEKTGKTVSRGDRFWSNGVQPNFTFENLIPLVPN